MQAFNFTTTQLFKPDQVFDWSVEYWDTPFVALDSDAASGGIVMDVKEPHATYSWTTFRSDLDAATAANTLTVWQDAAKATARVTGGRTDNLVGYWAGGAPAYHGATTNGRVAYRFRCYLRSTTARAWFSNATNPAFFLALAGQGWVKVIKTVSGTPTQVFEGALTETGFLRDGFQFSDAISNMAAGDYLDIYYLQDLSDPWGGFVVKAVLGAKSGTDSVNQTAAIEASILGCGLFDDDAARAGTLIKRTLKFVNDVEVSAQVGQAMSATFKLPLINPTVHDGFGWEWYRSAATDPGVLRMWDSGAVQFTLKRERVVRVKATVGSETFTVFTGLIHNYDEPQDDAVAVQCIGFETRMLERFDKNLPDKVSYMSRGYRKLQDTSDPVYEVPAYDHWPMEHALADLMARAGIDASRYNQTLTVPKSDGTTTNAVVSGETHKTFRARTLGGSLIRLERQERYGNYGLAYTETLPFDDTYVFPPENKQELFNRSREMTDRYGFDFWFDEAGNAYLRGRNNPHGVADVGTGDRTAGTDTQTVKTSPSAYAGTYVELNSVTGGNTYQKQVTAARIDVVLPRGTTLKPTLFRVIRVSDLANVSGNITIDPATGVTSDIYYYDQYLTVDGSNATVATLYSGQYDTYRIEWDDSVGGSGLRRYDCFLLFHTDPGKPLYPSSLATDTNAFDVQPQSTMDDMRNMVTIVGRRKATTTDSEKFDQNPENPEGEFIVERAVDLASIVDPTATNFVGYPKESIIYDSKIADPGVARYLATAFIYRQRNPKPSAKVDHSILPAVQRRDPVYVVDARHNTVTSTTTLYVTGYRHRLGLDQATTEITTTSFPEFAGYEPREDIDIDTYFNGNPVANVEVTYTSLTGQVQTNLPITAPHDYGKYDATAGDIVTVTKTKSTGAPFWSDYLDLAGEAWPPVPGTLMLKATNATAAGNVTRYYPQDMTFAAYHASVGNNAYGLKDAPPDHVPLQRGGSYAIAIPTASTIVSVALQSIRVETVVENVEDPLTGRTVPTVRGYHWTVDGNFTASQGDNGSNPYYWEWSDTFRTLTLFRRNTGGSNHSTHWVQVVYTGAVSEVASTHVGETPYHHYMNVDYRDAQTTSNHILWSEDFTQWPKTAGTTVTADFTTAPDGTTTADRVVFAGNDAIWKITSLFDQSGKSAAGSVWLRADSAVSVTLQFYNVGSTETTTPLTANLTTEWQRFSLGRSFTTNDGVIIHISKTSAVTFYAWGGQVSEGSTSAKDYVKTTTLPLSGVTAAQRVYLPWKEGDSSSPYTLSTLGATSFSLRYRSFLPKLSGGSRGDPYSGNAPFYDPYTSELGYLVQVKFSALVSGYYRVSIRSQKDNTIVAWLTEPTSEPDDVNSHWTYITAGAGKSLSWDGVDQRGEWNATQSEQYAIFAQGTFEQEQRPVVGRGFYAWNREVDGGTPGKLAIISADRDPNGKPVFGQGTYGTWYVQVEVKNTKLAEIAAATPYSTTDKKSHYPRVVSTESLDTTNGQNSTSSAYIFTHLPVPSRARIQIHDWVGGTFDETDQAAIASDANWGSAATDAYINNAKPVRIRFLVESRPGTLWTNRQGDVEIRTVRDAHLRALIHDQAVLFEGINYPDTTTEQRKVLSRRLVNDSHTLRFEDDGYRRASGFRSSVYPNGTTEWIFLPKYFKKQFRINNVTEAIRFGDYLQLEEVPYWDASRSAATRRSRFQIAFLAYLFYLSAYTQDRSGRMVWAVPQTFLDKSKITTNAVYDWPDITQTAANAPIIPATAATYRTPWPDDPLYQHRRAVVTRQWLDEGTWQADQRTAFNLSVGSIGDKLLKHKWKDHEHNATDLNGAAWPVLDTDDYSRYHRDVVNAQGLRLPAAFVVTRQLGAYSGGSTTSRLGDWDWELAPTWIPCVVRDFHPYFLLPPMVDPSNETTSRTTFTYTFTDNDGPAANGEGQSVGNDAAVSETWSSPIWDMTQAYSTATNNSAKVQFWPDNRVQKGKQPTTTVNSNTLDYIRQDETVHYEDLRGMYSRGSKPQQAPIKVTPVSPYYINQFKYAQSFTKVENRNKGYPVFRNTPDAWFELKFRSTYLWESATLFPVNELMIEKLEAVNLYLTRYHRQADLKQAHLTDHLRYDAGAWTGWKDDLTGSTIYGVGGTSTSVFKQVAMPVAIGPTLTETKDIYMHLVLVPERTGV